MQANARTCLMPRCQARLSHGRVLNLASGVPGPARIRAAWAAICPSTRSKLPGRVLESQHGARWHARHWTSVAQATGGGGDKDPFQAEVNKLKTAASRLADEVTSVLTPRQAYDAMDMCLMVVSTLVFIWVAGAMYVLYAHLYYSRGQW